MKRRDFFKGMTAVVGAAMLAPVCALAKEEVQTIPAVANGETFVVNCSKPIRLEGAENGVLQWDKCTIHILDRDKVDAAILSADRENGVFVLGNKLNIALDNCSITNCEFYTTNNRFYTTG